MKMFASRGDAMAIGGAAWTRERLADHLADRGGGLLIDCGFDDQFAGGAVDEQQRSIGDLCRRRAQRRRECRAIEQ